MPEVNKYAAAEAGTAILELPAQVAKKPSFAERAAERDLVVGMKLRADALAMTDKIMRLRAPAPCTRSPPRRCARSDDFKTSQVLIKGPRLALEWQLV
jgi:hypothetical protein